MTFVLDGGNNTDDNSASPSGAQARTPLETVEEFQVQTNQFDVEFGRTTGGVVNAITKRGTNAFRGSAFGYLTNSAMTAPTYFAKLAGEGESETDKHQYGGTVGGPIMRDKLHFFGSFERYVVGTGLTNVFPTRPELNWSAKEGLNGRNYMIRVDHQINANNTYTGPLPDRAPAQPRPAHWRPRDAQHGELRARHRSDCKHRVQPRHRDQGAEHDPGVDRDGRHPARRGTRRFPGDQSQGSRASRPSLPELRRAGTHQRAASQCPGARDSTTRSVCSCRGRGATTI